MTILVRVICASGISQLRQIDEAAIFETILRGIGLSKAQVGKYSTVKQFHDNVEVHTLSCCFDGMWSLPVRTNG